MVYYKIHKTAYKTTFDLIKVNTIPYEVKEVIFSGSMSDCVAYITALKDNLLAFDR